MRIFHGFDALESFVNPVVTVGSYDGVHKGHMVLLGRIINIAKEKKGESVVLTFHPHPRQILGGGCGVKLLNSLEEKLMLLEKAGIDNVIIIPFTKEFSFISSYDFVKDLLVDKIGVSTLIVGYNHHFGHNREGNFDYLDKMCADFGFDIYMLPKQEVDNDKVSSTAVRNCIEQGDMQRAEEFLGYPYFMTGTVTESGDFVIDEPCKLLPPDGDYTVEILDDKNFTDSEVKIDNRRVTLPTSIVSMSSGRVRLTFK